MTDKMLVKKFKILRILVSRPRLFLAIIIGVTVSLLIPNSWAHQTITKTILGWNTGVILYLFFAAKMIFKSNQNTIKIRAQHQDEGSFIILLLVVLATLVSLGAIVAELAVSKDIKGYLKYAHILLAGVTIATSWAFTHTMFALHYAHDYYLNIIKEKPGGLTFPDTLHPDYSDFLYFAAIIGTSGQTADISFSSNQMRRTGLIHSVLSFFFNTTLIALTINIGSSLL